MAGVSHGRRVAELPPEFKMMHYPALTAGVLLWGRVGHHVKREAIASPHLRSPIRSKAT